MRKALLSLLVGFNGDCRSVRTKPNGHRQNHFLQTNQKGLIGVNVLIKGTTVGVVTDLDGNYSLQLPANATTLVFSYIGYYKQRGSGLEIESVIDVSMNPDTQNLEEVIITAYGTADKGNFTGQQWLLRLIK